MLSRRDMVRYVGASSAALALPLPIATAEMESTGRLPTRPIPATGEPLPILGLGNSRAFRFGDVEISRALVEILVDKGGSFIDTFGDSQIVLGQIMRERGIQDKLFLGTNVSADDTQAGRQSITESQEIQGKEILDLLQINRLGDVESQWRNLREWKEAGMTRYIGVAIAGKKFYDAVIALIETGTADFAQVNYSMLEPEAGERLLPLAQDKGVAIVVNRPFINGRYFRLVGDKELPEWAAEFDCHSWAQFSLKFILAHPAVNCVLTETANPDHARENLAAGFGRLPDKRTRQRMLQLMQSL